MAYREIVKEGDAILRKKSKEIKIFDDKLEELLDDMASTMLKYNGVGIAGPQVGVLKRVVIVNINNLFLEKRLGLIPSWTWVIICSWGNSLSKVIKSKTPQIKPAGIINNAILPLFSNCSLAGRSKEKKEAAIIIPAELPKATQINFLLALLTK